MLSFSIVALYFASCGDETITPAEKYVLDSGRYDWTQDTLFSTYILDIYAQDTNNIYYGATEKLVFYDGKNYQYHDFSADFFCSSMSGINNNVYLGGLDNPPSHLYKPKLKKWNGSGFQDILLNDTANSNDYITSVLAKSDNEIWAGSNDGRIYNYDGINVNTFYFDTNMSITPILKDESDNLYFVGSIYYGLLFDSIKVQVNKYISNEWTTTYSKTFHAGDGLFNFRNLRDGEIAAGNFKFNTLYKFDGYNLNGAIDIKGFNLAPHFYGFSFNNLLCLGTDDKSRLGLYHWNNSKWSHEEPILTENTRLFYGINDTYFCSYTDKFFNSYILTGKLKKR